MNIVKFRPVGSPSGRVVRVRVTQSKRAMYATHRGQYAPSLARTVKSMLNKGFVRVNGGAL